MNWSIVATCGFLVASGTAAFGQNPRTPRSDLRVALARPYRAIADSALPRLLKEYPPGDAPYFATADSARAFLFGKHDDAGLSEVHIFKILGARGVVFALVSFSLNDDPSDHGFETGRTLIVDTAGHVVASEPQNLYIRRIAARKAITPFGVIWWNGNRWIFPKWVDRRSD